MGTEISEIPDAGSVVADLVDYVSRTNAPAVDESLIGLFQAFRPDGIPAEALLRRFETGAACASRLDRLYSAVLASARADAMKDAYFIVRNPEALAPDMCGQLARDFLVGLFAFAEQLESKPINMQPLDGPPAIRILEGKPPKHPKAENEKVALLKLVAAELPSACETQFETHSVGHRLSEALYFVACDVWLKEYLRWPLVQSQESQPQDSDLSSFSKALESYFELWRHGVKFRIFANHTVDFYLPRSTATTNQRSKLGLRTD